MVKVRAEHAPERNDVMDMLVMQRIAIRVICVSIMERIITMVDYIGRQNNRLSSRRLHRAVTKNTYLPCSKAKVIVVRSATSAGPKY